MARTPIVGRIVDPAGNVHALKPVSFIRKAGGVVADGSGAVSAPVTMPDPITDAAGNLPSGFMLDPDTYIMSFRGARGTVSVEVPVPASVAPLDIWALIDAPAVPVPEIDLAAEAAARVAGDAVSVVAGTASVRAWAASVAAGLAAVADGDTFLVVTPGAFEHRRRDGAAASTLLITGNEIHLERYLPEVGATASLIVTACTTLLRKEVPLALILGTAYAGAGAAGTLNAALPTLCGAGLSIVDNLGLTVAMDAQVIAPAGFSMTCRNTIWNKTFIGTGNIAMFVSPDYLGVAEDGFYWSGGKIRLPAGNPDAGAGVIFRINANDAVIENADIEYKGGQALLPKGDSFTVRFCKLRSQNAPEDVGDGGIRFQGGKGFRCYGNDVFSSDDPIQIVVNTTTSPVVNISGARIYGNVTNGYAHMANISQSSNPPQITGTYTGLFEDIVFEGHSGTYGVEAIRMSFDNVAPGRRADSIIFRDFDGKHAGLEAFNQTALFRGTYHDTIGTVRLENIRIVGVTQSDRGLSFDAPGSTFILTGNAWEGKRHAVRILRPEGVFSTENGEFIHNNLFDGSPDVGDPGGEDIGPSRRDVIYVDKWPAFAKDAVDFTGAGFAGQTLTVAGVVYTLRTTLAAPYDVLLGATPNATAFNLSRAINANAGDAGVLYGVGTLIHPTIEGKVTDGQPLRLRLTARAGGLAGNGIAVATNIAGATVSRGTTSGGDDQQGDLLMDFRGRNVLRGVYTPTVSGAPTKQYGIFNANPDTTILVDWLEVYKTAGATSTGAIWSAPGSTVVICEGISGDVDTLTVEGGATVLIAAATNFASRAEAAAWFAAGNRPTVGTVFVAGGETYRYTGSGTAIADLPGCVSFGPIRPEQFASNTSPGTTNMRSAIIAADALAASLGVPVTFTVGTVYGVQKVLGSPIVATANWVIEGTIRAIGTATNVDLVRTGAAGLTISGLGTLDNGGQLGSALQIMHANVLVQGITVRNGAFQGIRNIDQSGLVLRDVQAFDFVNKSIMVKATTAHIYGLVMKGVIADDTAIGLGSVNGCISVQGTEADPATFVNDPAGITWWVVEPDIDVTCRMLESSGYTTTGVSFECRRGIRGGTIKASCFGGRMPSFNDCFGTTIVCSSTGSDEDGIEFRGGRYSTLTGNVYEGLTEAPPWGIRVSLGIGHTVMGNFVCRSGEGEDPLNNGAPVILNGCSDVTVIGTGRRLNSGKHYILNRGSKNCWVQMKFFAVGAITVDQAVTLDTRVTPSGDDGINVGGAGTCDGMVLSSCDFPTTTNAFKGFVSDTINGLRLLNGTRIRNTSAVDAIGALISNFLIDASSGLNSYPGALFPVARPLAYPFFFDYRSNDGPSLFHSLFSGGSPESLIDGKRGSMLISTDDANVWVKTTDTGDTGWRRLAVRGLVIDAANAAQTMTFDAKGPQLRSTGTLTADRNWRLGAAGAIVAARWRITRVGGGAFNLNILDNTSGLTLKALVTNSWADFEYDGTNWVLSAYGLL